MTIEEYLYRLSLEDPAHLGMFIGDVDISTLRAFVTGYREATQHRDDGFFEWLRDVANAFPGQGWAKHHLELANGDHQGAIGLFFERLHQWALETRPTWFTEFNSEPRASQLLSGDGVPLADDIRRASHVAAQPQR